MKAGVAGAGMGVGIVGRVGVGLEVSDSDIREAGGWEMFELVFIGGPLRGVLAAGRAMNIAPTIPKYNMIATLGAILILLSCSFAFVFRVATSW